MRPQYLADKSALARMPHAVVAQRLRPLLESGLVATCGVIDLEVLYSADAGSYEAVLAERRALPRFAMTESTFEMAVETQRRMAVAGQHRVPIPDLLVAAVAEQHNVAVLHYDRDFERIAEFTGQPHRWVASPGSL